MVLEPELKAPMLRQQRGSRQRELTGTGISFRNLSAGPQWHTPSNKATASNPSVIQAYATHSHSFHTPILSILLLLVIKLIFLLMKI